MNHAGELRCEAFQNRQETVAELQHTLTQMKIMSILCHCSSELDQGMLLYSSVHNIFLSSGDYILILFSEISDPTPEAREFVNPYSRVYGYRLIEEEVQAALSGHVTFYSSELDGRLVVLVLYHYGLIPALRTSLINQLAVHCAEVSAACREKYDMDVMAYISDVMNQVSMISSTYHKMLSTATLHRYIRKKFDDPVFRLFRPEPGRTSPFRLPIQEKARSIANAVVEQGDYHQQLDEVLNAITDTPLQSIDEMKGRFGDLFEALCAELRGRGIRINVEQLRREQILTIIDEPEWSKPVAWLHGVLEEVALRCTTNNQTLLKKMLEQAESYIMEHLDVPTLSVKEVAEAIQISPTGLSVMFRHQLQTTPAKYIREHRLRHAAELLRNTNRSIQDICTACGFGSLETFHRTFKAEFGVTPGKLRRLAIVTSEQGGT